MTDSSWKFISYDAPADFQISGRQTVKASSFYVDENYDASSERINIAISENVDREELKAYLEDVIGEEDVLKTIFFKHDSLPILTNILEELLNATLEKDISAEQEYDKEEIRVWAQNINIYSESENNQNIENFWIYRMSELPDMKWSEIGKYREEGGSTKAISTNFPKYSIACGTVNGDILTLDWISTEIVLERTEANAENGLVTGITWNSAGNSIAAGFDNGKLIIWHVGSGFREVASWSFSSEITAVDWSRNNIIACTTQDGLVRIIDPVRKTVETSYSSDARKLKVLWNHKDRLVFNKSDEQLVIIDPNEQNQEIFEVPNGESISCFDVNQNEEIVCITRSGHLYLRTSRQWHTYEDDIGIVTDIKWEPNADRFAFSTVAGSVELLKWSNSRFSAHQILFEKQKAVNCISWMSSSMLIISFNSAYHNHIVVWSET